MTGLRVGRLSPKQIYYGSTPVTAVYYGATKIWPEYPEWSSSARYQKGDIVRFEGRYYQISISSYGEPPSPTSSMGRWYWTEVFP